MTDQASPPPSSEPATAPARPKGPPPRVFSGMQPSGTLHLGNYMMGLSEHLTPIRLRAKELMAKPEIVHDALADGARRCRGIAEETMREVRDRIGLIPAKS